MIALNIDFENHSIHVKCVIAWLARWLNPFSPMFLLSKLKCMRRAIKCVHSFHTEEVPLELQMIKDRPMTAFKLPISFPMQMKLCSQNYWLQFLLFPKVIVSSQHFQNAGVYTVWGVNVHSDALMQIWFIWPSLLKVWELWSLSLVNARPRSHMTDR